MKKTLYLCSVIIIVLFLTACSITKDNNRVLPTRTFFSHSAIVNDINSTYYITGSDNTSLRLWIDSVGIEKLLDANVTDKLSRDSEYDISDNWTYRIQFIDTDNIIIDGTEYYIPSTATVHIVYINEELHIIQFDNTSYSFVDSINNEPDEIRFCDGVRVYIN